MHRFLLSICFILWIGFFVQAQVEKTCEPAEDALDYWRAVKGGQVPEGKSLDELALELEACLGSPDPELRDGMGYELFTGWLRGNSLSEETKHQLFENLSDNLNEGLGEVGTDSVFLRAFSALILSEVIRADAQSAFLSDAERRALLETTLAYLEGERDFRGLDAEVGWIHGVAHASDILWRLAMHPATVAEDHRLILDAVATAALPEEATFYTFDEGDRLARVVVAVMGRNLLPQDEVNDWLKQFSSPKSLSSWSGAFASPAGMAELHNSKLFVRGLHSQLRFNGSAEHKESYLSTLQTVLRVLAGLV